MVAGQGRTSASPLSYELQRIEHARLFSSMTMGIRARPRPHHLVVHASNLVGVDGGGAALP